jgi:hypothetical protein
MSPAHQPSIGTSIVMVGSFNPAIIHPSWFARFEVLPPSDLDTDAADVRFVTPEFSTFQLAWLRVQVTPDRFELSTLEQDRVPLLRDAGINVFTLLSHTPVSAIGLNRAAHLPLAENGWSNIRTALAPLRSWEDIGVHPALMSQTVQLEREKDDDPGFILISVEPSQRIPDGFFIAVNDHHELSIAEDQQDQGEAPAVALLDSKWSAAMAIHEKYTRFMIELAGES